MKKIEKWQNDCHMSKLIALQKHAKVEFAIKGEKVSQKVKWAIIPDAYNQRATIERNGERKGVVDLTTGVIDAEKTFLDGKWVAIFVSCVNKGDWRYINAWKEAIANLYKANTASAKALEEIALKELDEIKGAIILETKH